MIDLDELVADLVALEGKDDWLFLERAGKLDVLGYYTDESRIPDATINRWAATLPKQAVLSRRPGKVILCSASICLIDTFPRCGACVRSWRPVRSEKSSLSMRSFTTRMDQTRSGFTTFRFRAAAACSISEYT